MTIETMQRRASIFHGYGASPEDHWFAWLAGQLEADGIRTTIPALPNSHEPDPAQWAKVVRADLGIPNQNSIIVAHSLGCLTVLRYLRSLSSSWQLDTLVLISGFLDQLPAFPELNSFIRDGCDVEGLRNHIPRLTIIRSDADPYVPAGHTDRLANLLGTSARVVPGGGHFLASDGITSLPAVLESIVL